MKKLFKLFASLERVDVLEGRAFPVGSGGTRIGQVLRPRVRQIHVTRDARGAGHDARRDGSRCSSAASARTSRPTALLPVTARSGATVDVTGLPTDATVDRYRLSTATGATTYWSATVPTVLSRRRRRRQSRHRYRSSDTLGPSRHATTAISTILATRPPSCRPCS